jgi:4-aminobutyrate--pyruvate transaminase
MDHRRPPSPEFLPMTPPPAAARANSAAARDIANLIHPYTDLRAHQEAGPMVITRGEGVRVWDETGKSYIESVAGLWCASLGFSNERLVQAAAAQMRKLPFYHAFTAKSHEPMIDLGEMLIARAPVPMSKVFFANSGSEANDTAIKMVWYFNNEEKTDRPDQGVSRHHIGRRFFDRAAGEPSQFRCPARRVLPHHDAAFLQRRLPRRDRGRVCHPLRG